MVNLAQLYYKFNHVNRSKHKQQRQKRCQPKQKADGFARLYRDVSNHKIEKHDRGMKKLLNGRLRSEVVDPEECQGLTTDEVKAALHNINPIKAARPDKNHPRFLHQAWSLSIC